MPGIPKSHACEPCKSRHVRCDEAWPTCSPCTRKKIKCPGPSSLIKFIVHDGGHADHRQKTPGSASGSQALQIRPSSAAEVSRTMSQDGPHTYRRTFRVSNPRPALNTTAGRVAAVLARHLDSPHERLMMTHMLYLPFLVNRLEFNPSLRDSVDFLCSIWASHRREEPLAEFISMPMYGRAIRSLSRTLRSDMAFTMETVASIIILQRTQDLFDPCRQKFQHEDAVTALLARIGPPKLDDLFHGSIISEIFGLLVPFWITQKGWQGFMSHPPWRDTIVNLIHNYVGETESRSSIESTMDEANYMCARMSEIHQLQKTLNGIKNHPDSSSFARSSLVSEITNAYSEVDSVGDKMCSRIFDKVPDFLGGGGGVRSSSLDTGTSHCLPLLSLPEQTPLFLITLRLYVLRRRYQWLSINKLPDAPEIHQKLSNLCDQNWALISHVLKITCHYVAAIPGPEDALTLGFSDEEEKVHLLDIFTELERSERLLFTTDKCEDSG